MWGVERTLLVVSTLQLITGSTTCIQAKPWEYSPITALALGHLTNGIDSCSSASQGRELGWHFAVRTSLRVQGICVEVRYGVQQHHSVGTH